MVGDTENKPTHAAHELGIFSSLSLFYFFPHQYSACEFDSTRGQKSRMREYTQLLGHREMHIRI